jgi:hypothetical protein
VYVPVPGGAVPPTEDVRVYLSRRGLADLPEDFTTGRSYVTARWTKATPDSVMLQVPIVRRVDDPNAPDIRQNLFVARTDVVDVRSRRFSGPRSALAIGGAIGAGVAIVTVVLKAGGNDTLTPGEGPEQLRVP